MVSGCGTFFPKGEHPGARETASLVPQNEEKVAYRWQEPWCIHMNDLRFAIRQLAKAPGFLATALLTLAVGVGTCTAIFSVVNNVLLRPLAFPESDRVMGLRETFLPRLPEFSVASGKYFVWREQARSFESFAAFQGTTYNLTGGPGEPLQLTGLRMTASALPTFRVRPLLGRNFTEEEDRPGSNNVVILSYGFWQRQFGGRPGVVGSKLQLHGRSHRVVGVLPRESPLPDEFEVATPMAFERDDRSNFGGHSIGVIGRLRPGITAEQARSELAVIQQRIGQQHGGAKGWGIKLRSVMEERIEDMRPVLLSLLGAVGLLLLIACANVANLLLARATGRAREIAVRAAMGASRGRIVRQLLVESMLLGLAGGILGVLFAHAGLKALLALAPENLPRLSEVAVDGRALAFTLVLALLTGIGFGLAPAYRSARVDLNRTLKAGGRGTSEGGRSGRLVGALVVAEVSVALMLLAGAGLLMRSFVRLSSVSPGFRPEGALVVSLNLPPVKYDTEEEQAAFVSQALRRLAALPGVKSLGVAQRAPFAGGQEHRGLEVEGHPLPVAEMPISNHYTVSPGYLKALGIPLLRGRDFGAQDVSGSKRVALVNESVARTLFGDRDPLGKRITISNDADGWREIVGIVGDIRNRSLDGDVTLQTYEPFAQVPSSRLDFIVRTSSAVSGQHAAIRSAIYAVDAQQPIARIRPLTDFVARSMARQRFAMTLFGVFSGVALLLAAIGIYGVMAYSVNRRTNEFGVRMALGAHTAQMLRLVLRQGGRLVGLGIVIGLGAALSFARLLSSLLFGVGPYDPLTFIGIVTLLAAVGVGACVRPAWRAAKLDPMNALRAE